MTYTMADVRKIADIIEHCPEQRIAAAVVKTAMSQAIQGDRDAHDWFHSDRCLGWLSLLTPDDPWHARDLAQQSIARRKVWRAKRVGNN